MANLPLLFFIISLSVVISTSVWIVLSKIFKDIRIGALLTLACQIIFWQYGYAHIILSNRLEFLSFKILFLLFLIIRYKRRWIKIMTPRLNFISAVFLAFAIMIVVYTAVQHKYFSANFDVNTNPINIEAQANGYPEDILPDIYFIVLDAFPRQDVSEMEYGETIPLYDELENMGFTIAQESNANYLFTMSSLASMLNFAYITERVEGGITEDSKNESPLVELIRNNRLCKTVKAIGYQYITFDSTWEPTTTSKCADQVLDNDKNIEDIFILYMNTTLLRSVMSDSLLLSFRESRLETFDQILSISAIDAPTFTFAHVLLPHQPYMFDENGDNFTHQETINTFLSGSHKAQAFYQQTIYTSNRVSDLVQDIINNSDVPPIIIIQSDHGPDYLGYSDDPEVINLRTPVLSAYYLPFGGDALMYPSISPVNIFRVVLNYYFDAGLELLEDRTYFVSYNDDYLYNYRDITDTIAPLR